MDVNHCIVIFLLTPIAYGFTWSLFWDGMRSREEAKKTRAYNKAVGKPS